MNRKQSRLAKLEQASRTAPGDLMPEPTDMLAYAFPDLSRALDFSDMDLSRVLDFSGWDLDLLDPSTWFDGC